MLYLAIKGVNSTGFYLRMLYVMPFFHVCKDAVVSPSSASHAVVCAEAVAVLVWSYSMFAVSALPYASSQLFMAFQQHELYVTLEVG